MLVVDDPAALPDVQRDVQAVIDAVAQKSVPMHGLERFAFYGAARQAFAVVQLAIRGGYGCFLLRKGVIFDAC